EDLRMLLRGQGQGDEEEQWGAGVHLRIVGPADCAGWTGHEKRWPILQGMKLYTYLNYGGNCEKAFRFYEQHLGGKIIMMMTHGQMPNANTVSPNWKNAILHARINIGE